MWAKVASAFKRNDGDASSVPPQQDGRIRTSHDESGSDSAGEHIAPGSPSKHSKRGILRRGSRLLDKDNGASLSLAKRVKSSLHMNTNMNESNMSLTSTTKTELGAQPVTGSVRSIFNKARRPSAMQMQAAMNKSDDTLNRESAEELRSSSPSPTLQLRGPTSPLEAQQFGSVRSILRDRNTPGSGQNVRFFSRDAYRVISPNTSATMSTDNTGGSGDAVDAPPFMQRIQEMSPDRDGASQDTTKYHSVNSTPNMFSPASVYASPNSAGFDHYPTATSTPYLTPEVSQAQGQMPVPPPQLAGLFDFSASHEYGVHSIHAAEAVVLRDDAVEVDEFGRPVRNASPASVGTRPSVDAQSENRVSSHSTASSMSIATPLDGSEGSLHRLSGGSDDTRFHSLAEDGGEKQTLSARTASLQKVFKRDGTPPGEGRTKLDFPGSGNASSRVRALSERVFSRPALDDPKNKADDDNAMLRGGAEPDPFSADASNYYNAAAGFPKTPPRIGHVRSDSVVSGVSMQSGRSGSEISHRSASGGSRSSGGSATRARGFGSDDETITALRTQLAFHQELATQYEADIRARDAHAALMSQKLQAHEAEAERRAKAMRGMRRRVTELERAAAALEEQAERNALESFERSVMDGASGEAMRALQQQMMELERERNELASRERDAKMESMKAMEALRLKEEALMDMKRRVEEGGQNMDLSSEDVRLALEKAQREAEQHQQIQLEWADENARLIAQQEALQKELDAKASELNVLKSEVEAQWANTEKLNEKVDALRTERDDLDREREHLKNEIDALERRIEDMEGEWTESETRKVELENELAGALAAKGEVERERDQLRREFELMGVNGGDYGSALTNLESQVRALREERQAAIDDAQHLEQMLQEREEDDNEREQRKSVNDYDADKLRAELTSLRREHARVQTEHARYLSEADVRASDAVELRNEMARKHAAAEAEAKELRERLTKMQEENEKMKTNIHVLKQQSADQDVRILQLEKQHDQATEDKLGLNIALDSKQQELELLKRSMGVRGTAGSTPAVPNRAGGRRDSTAFRTPIPALRPSSSLSDGARRGAAASVVPSSLSDTERGKAAGTLKTTLGRSTRPNVGSMPTVPSKTTTTVKRASRLSDTSLSAPPGRARTSTASSDTPRASARPAPTTKHVMSPPSSAIRTATGRRASISISGIGAMSDTSASAQSDKENETPRARLVNAAAARRKSMQPLAVPA